jgi:hypothetical protein
MAIYMCSWVDEVLREKMWSQRKFLTMYQCLSFIDNSLYKIQCMYILLDLSLVRIRYPQKVCAHIKLYLH